MEILKLILISSKGTGKIFRATVKILHIRICGGVKVVLGGKFIPLNAYIRRLKINELALLKLKRCQIKSPPTHTNLRKEIKAEINETGNKP